MIKQNWIKIILTPFSWVYGLITDIRNQLFDLRILQSKKPDQFVISIGNITVGGTGKTPMTEHLVGLLSAKKSLAILSRGYGRSTKGFLLADESSSAADIGDEPLQYFEKYKKKVVVAVCENRVNGAKQIRSLHPEIDILLLDDAFQHRAIAQDVKLLLTDFSRPFYKDLPFPAGRLRETRRGAKRADAVVVTKCPTGLTKTDKEIITKNIRKYSDPPAPVFFSSIKYAAPVSYSGTAVALKNVKLVAGIANPETFVAHIRQQFSVIEEIIFADHHNYSSDDLERLTKYLKNDTFVVTTEKDMVKLKPLVEKSGIVARFAYIPITVDFGDDSEHFNQWVMKKIL